MRKFVTKSVAVVLIATSAVMMTGCYGSFSLTSKLHSWNGTVSNSKFVNELVFFALCVIPAYELCALGDALIFNSVEFWGGSNPIAMNEGQIEETDVLRDGQMYKMIKSKNSLTVAACNSDVKVDFKYFPKEKTWYMIDGENKVKVADLKGNAVFTYLPNNKTLVFDKNNIDLVEAEVMAAK